MKIFKPMLAPNDKVDLDIIKYPIMVSTKLDGIRAIFKDGHLLSRSLKEIPNKQLQEKYQHLKDYSKNNNVILDGEFYGVGLTFQEITHNVMTEDLDLINEKLPEKLMFFCFDCIIDQNPEQLFKERYDFIKKLKLNGIVIVKQNIINSKEEIDNLFKIALEGGYEGLILKALSSKYKFGRVTLKSGDMFKLKPFITFDGKIIGVEERFKNTSEKYTNELGRSQRHSFKDEVEPTGIAACFVVTYDGFEQRVIITGDEAFRREIWNNQKAYIGKIIEFKGMVVGSKERIRHPTFIRFRDDKEIK
jgi:DNA ligase-1